MKTINIHDLPLFDPADHIHDEEAAQAFLADAQQDGPEFVAAAQVIVERARKRWSLPAPGDGSADRS